MTRSRADSQFSVHTIYNTNNPNYLQRQNSTASLDSSVYSEGIPAPNLANYQFNPNFDQSLLEHYNCYINQPNITPFDHNFPPSGILSKISKSFLTQYDGPIDLRPNVNEELLNSTSQVLTLIRIRLLKLIQNDLETHSIPLKAQHCYRTNSMISMESNVDMVNIPQFLPSSQLQTPPLTFNSSMIPPPQSFGYNSNSNSSSSLIPPPPLPTLDFNIKRKHSLNQLQQPSSIQQTQVPPPLLQKDYFNSKSPSLYSPYEQSFPSPLGNIPNPLLAYSSESNDIKTTLMRKRDSLNLKRNGG